jgi:hypothetical protein
MEFQKNEKKNLFPSVLLKISIWKLVDWENVIFF